MTTDNIFTPPDSEWGSEEMVAIPRAEYTRLLYLTTAKPIETAPHNEKVLMFCYGEYHIASWDKNQNYFDSAQFALESPAHWLPLPNTPPIPKPSTINQLSDDPQDALGE